MNVYGSMRGNIGRDVRRPRPRLKHGDKVDQALPPAEARRLREGGCCKAADDVLFELPADTALSYATLRWVLDNVIERLQAAKIEAEATD